MFYKKEATALDHVKQALAQNEEKYEVMFSKK